MATLPRSSQTSVVDKATILRNQDGIFICIEKPHSPLTKRSTPTTMTHTSTSRTSRFFKRAPQTTTGYIPAPPMPFGWSFSKASFPTLLCLAFLQLHASIYTVAYRTIIDRLHDAGLHHGDLHPENIIVGDGGRVWLLDFSQSGRRKPPKLHAVDVEKSGGHGSTGLNLPRRRLQ